jgi:ABC-type multidrug transport system ATPase subunit
LRRNQDRGTTILLVTHNLHEAERIVQRVAIMRAGRMLAIGRPGSLDPQAGRSVRVELTLAPGAAAHGAVARLRDGWAGKARLAGVDRWTITASREELGTVVPRLLAALGADAVEDLRLQTHSLEDLYLALDPQEGAPR